MKKRFVLCVVLGGVAALFVHASFYSFLVGLVVGFIFGWLPTKMAPGCDSEQKRNEWCWFVIMCAVAIAVFSVMVWPRPDHGWISFPEPKEPPTSLWYDLWYAVAKFRLANVAATIFLVWLFRKVPPLRQVRRWLVT